LLTQFATANAILRFTTPDFEIRTVAANDRRHMQHNSDYYREQATQYREFAEQAADTAAKQEFLELAAACEEAADKTDDCRASG
jgi:hypothetical protein